MNRAALSVLALCAALPVAAQQAADAVEPEAETTGEMTAEGPVAAGLAAKDAGQPVLAQDWMIAAANPLAVEAGARILREGGTAADAMVAVQTVLGLVEPQSSGLGGGAFLVWYDAATGELTTLDGRETAPLDATPRLFQNDDGTTMGFWDAVVGGRSVGVPGTPALMEKAHQKWGRHDWADLFTDAIEHADAGFEVSPRLAELVAGEERLKTFRATRDYFYPEGEPVGAGDTLVNPAYAATLRAIAAQGADAFYTGHIADGIVATVRTAAGNPGVMTATDLALYEVKERPAICAAYRGMDVCGMGPPSSGALTVGQILGMLDTVEMPGSQDPAAWRLIGDASRLAFADRDRYMADSDFVPMPTAGLLDPAYLADRAALFTDSTTALESVSPGTPEWDHALLWGDDASIELPSTSHISIVDAYGNALSMTTTIENGFGSRLMAPGGFLLNNELTDFSFETHDEGRPIANRVEPGKRPRSSMAPTIVLENGEPALVIGSPGGSRIIGYVAQAIIAHVDWGMNVQAAVAMPHAVNRFGTFDVEEATSAADLETALTDLGFEVSVRSLNSGLHAIAITETGLEGGADPRREGIALGE